MNGARVIGYRVTTDAASFAFDELLLSRHVPDRSRLGVDPIGGDLRASGGLAYVLGRDLPSGLDRQAAIDAANYVVPAIVLCGDHEPSPWFLLGNPPSDPRGDLVSPPRISVGSGLAAGRLGNATPDPAAALAWLVGEIGGLTKGTIVVVDMFVDPVSCASGDRVVADLGDRGVAVAELVAGDGTDAIPDRWPPLGWALTDDLTSPLTLGRFRPIYDPADGSAEPWCLNDHCFVKGTDGTWHMLGITHLKPFNHAVDPGSNLAHATARALTQDGWRSEPFALTADPAHGEHLLWAPHVVAHEGLYHLFVCVGARDGYAYAIHRYESDDLWSWRRTSNGPVVVDSIEARDPMVVRDRERWIMYYTATERPDGGHFVVAAVTSDDLITWSSERRVVFSHPAQGGFGGPTESPFVVRRGPRWYLFVTDDDEVHVYASDDPLHWSPDDHVFAYVGHACEVVRDETGAWFISHVGWEQDGLWLAPLRWHDGLDDGSTSIDPALA